MSSQTNAQTNDVEANVTSSSDPASPAQEPQMDSRIFTTLTRVKDNLLDRPIKYDIISIVFSLLVLAGGIYGYIEHKSLPSLISGIVFFLLLALAIYIEGVRKNSYPLVVVVLFFGIMMVWRYTKNYNFWPAGLFLLLAFIMLFRHACLIYFRRQQSTVS